MKELFVAGKDKKNKKKPTVGKQPVDKDEICLLRSFDRCLAERLEVVHEFEGGFTGAGAGGLVTLYDLCFSVLGELGEFGIDLFNKLFHDDRFLFSSLNVNYQNFVQDKNKNPKNPRKTRKKLFSALSAGFSTGLGFALTKFIARWGPIVEKSLIPRTILSAMKGI